MARPTATSHVGSSAENSLSNRVFITASLSARDQENFFERERFGFHLLRPAGAQRFDDFRRMTVDDDFHFPTVLAHRKSFREVKRRRRIGKPDADFLEL